VWIGFGAVVAMMIVIVASVTTLIVPRIGVTYCTAGFETCITRSRYSPWHVVRATCPPDQSLRFTHPAIVVGTNHCHSIAVPGLSAPLDVCAAACAK
jgi:hypothetical protein